ncbi:cytochrome P450 [Trichodelitschia bisporula]|uniref:Cytochrome P450 n=1 Tax=Trichodelitschia bisporula TaxID=703511 RepID=A0A6G1HR14_9PEZI|nr:cytochrome P450 [Trichodelitschia bisporula]
MALTTFLATAFGVLSIIYYAYKHITTLQARKRLAAQHGCQPLMHFVPAHNPLVDFTIMKESIKAARDHTLLSVIQARFQKSANTFGARLIRKPIVATVEPANIKTILSTHFKDYSLGARIDSLGPLLGMGIFTTDGAIWAHSRALIRPNFAKDQVADLASFERHMQSLLKLIPRDGSTVDLQSLFFSFTIDSATEFLFGTSTNTLAMAVAGREAGDAERFAVAFNVAQDACAQRFRRGFLARFRRDPEGDAATAECHAFVDQFVDEAVRYRADVEKGLAKEDKYVFLHELAKATSDKRQLRDELLNVLLAGRDTTASLLSNMWFMLAKHPEVWAKLRREVEQELQGRLPTYEQLRNLKYLKYCMNESLRLHPVVPSNSRLALVDTILPLGGGPDSKSPLLIPAGTLVTYSPYAMHRRTDLFGPDAADFKPERWETLRPGWEYLPFNGGPRICLGQQYALTEAGYVTVRLLQEFERCEDRDGGVWEESLTLTVCSRNGTKVGLTPVEK